MMTLILVIKKNTMMAMAKTRRSKTQPMHHNGFQTQVAEKWRMQIREYNGEVLSFGKERLMDYCILLHYDSWVFAEFLPLLITYNLSRT